MTDQKQPKETELSSRTGLIVVVIVLAVIAGAVWSQGATRSDKPVQSGAVCPEPASTSQSGSADTKPTEAPALPQTPQTTPPVQDPNVSTGNPTGLPRFLDLGTTTCRPCQMMIPVMEQLEKEYAGKLDVEFINVSKNASAAQQYRVRVIPLQIFFDPSGKELFRHEGYWPKEEIIRKWKELGYEFG